MIAGLSNHQPVCMFVFSFAVCVSLVHFDQKVLICKCQEQIMGGVQFFVETVNEKVKLSDTPQCHPHLKPHNGIFTGSRSKMFGSQQA
jgi:hypothetical protein